MAFTVNGIGTSMCAGRGLISWVPGSWWSRLSTHDYDGCLCFCILFMPIVPLSSVHVYSRAAQGMGEQFLQIPIRWSIVLILRAFAARWKWALVLAGATLCFIALAESQQPRTPDHTVFLAGLGAFFLVIAAMVHLLLLSTDTRTVDLRRVMMATPFGSSDPATWTSAMLQTVYTAHKIFGAPTFLDAAARALDSGEFGRAMLAARYAAALENAAEGEALTDEILSHPDVAAALPLVHRDPNLWRSSFGKGLESMSPAPPLDPPALPPPLPPETLPEADDRIQSKSTEFR